MTVRMRSNEFLPDSSRGGKMIFFPPFPKKIHLFPCFHYDSHSILLTFLVIKHEHVCEFPHTKEFCDKLSVLQCNLILTPCPWRDIRSSRGRAPYKIAPPPPSDASPKSRLSPVLRPAAGYKSKVRSTSSLGCSQIRVVPCP